jgi:carbamoyltransferase
MTAIVGISAFYHDAAAALIVDGEVVAAAEEERFSRQKHDSGFPSRALESCLRQAGLAPRDIDYVGFYDKPVLKFDRLLETYLAFAPRGFRSFSQAVPLWLRQKLHLKRELDRGLGGAFHRRYVFTHHHESHAASAFFPSPFETAAILTLDGVGEWATASMGVGRGNRIELTHELRFPHSVGLLYSAFTYFTGFKVNSDEYKLMGLAPYGEPVYADLLLEKVVDMHADGSIRLDLSYFDYCSGLRMTSRRMDALFGGPPRRPEAPITKREMDIAASVQKVTEEVVLRAAQALYRRTGERRICLAGGVALNCVANGRLLREGPFEDVWVQPAAGDAGGALGVALFLWHQLLGKPRTPAAHDAMQGALLGPRFADDDIRSFLDRTGIRYERFADDAALVERVAGALESGQVVGWFQGRMEFGPRALGSRSILADARNPAMQSIVNQKVKYREGFRPFAPAVLQEHVQDWFATRPGEESPYMLLVSPVHTSRRLALAEEEARAEGLAKLHLRRSVIPAVTHVDQSARIQTVDAERHGLYRLLLEAFHRRTGCPVLVNTSFNLGWEPIVCTPEEAYATFMSSQIDLLCLGHQVIEKRAQRTWVDRSRAPECGDPPPEGVLRRLLDRGRRDRIARALDGSLPYDARVLVLGPGCGDLACFLGIAFRGVVGCEESGPALEAAERFRESCGLERVTFVAASADALPFGAEAFAAAVVLAARATDVQAAVRCVLPGGHLVAAFRRPVLGPALRTLQSLGCEFVRAIPPRASVPDDLEPQGLFRAQPPGGALEHAIAALRCALPSRGHDGELLGGRRFALVARLPPAVARGGA